MSLILRSKLCVMMFLQFMLVASFWVQLSTYLDKMEVKGLMLSLIMSTMAIGSIFSPLVGMFADRVANSEKVLCVLNALVAGLLLAAFFTTNPTMIFVWLVLAMCAYMPTWGLTASIAMAIAHLKHSRLSVYLVHSVGFAQQYLLSLVKVALAQ